MSVKKTCVYTRHAWCAKSKLGAPVKDNGWLSEVQGKCARRKTRCDSSLESFEKVEDGSQLWSQHMSVIQFHEELSHLKKDGSGGKKKAPQYCQTFKAEKCGSLRQKEKPWCNFITPLNGFLITAAPFFRSNFAVLGKSCFVWGLCPDEEIMSQSLYLQSRGSQRTWVILIKDFKHNFVTPTASQILWLD